MKITEFVKAIIDYYGAFENEAVANLFIKYANKVRENDLERIYEWFLSNIAINWKIDVKTFIDACKVLQVPMRKPVKTCACCGTQYTGDLCSVCWYDPKGSGDVTEYRKMYEHWQIDSEEHTRKVLETLTRIKENPFVKAERLKA